MKLAVKLNIMSVVALLGCAGIAGIAMKEFCRASDVFGAQTAAGVTLRSQLEADMMHDALRADVFASLLATTPEEHAEVRAALAEHMDLFTTSMSRNRTALAGTPSFPMLEKVLPILYRYGSSADRIIGLAAHDNAAARAKLDEFIADFETLETAMSELSDSIQEVAAQQEKQSNAAVAAGADHILLLGSAPVVLVGIVGFAVARSVGTALRRSVAAINDLASNKRPTALDEARQDELGQLARAVNAMVSARMGLVTNLSSIVETLNGEAEALTGHAQRVDGNIPDQTSQVSQLSAAITQMAAAANEVASKCEQVAARSDEAGQQPKGGRDVVIQTVREMEAISEQVEASSKAVADLAVRSEQIGKIIQVINDIADQTNLLALNAAIEAARAGEQGRGFAVVADKVRKLAERTQKATEEVSKSIEEIQQDTGSAIQLIEAGAVRVDSGVSLAGKAGTALSRIVDGCSRIDEMILAIAAASAEQATAGQEVASNISEMAAISRASAQAADQASHATELLAKRADELRAMVEQFKIERRSYDRGPGPGAPNRRAEQPRGSEKVAKPVVATKKPKPAARAH